MALLRLVLYLQALVWSVSGAALALVPRFTLVTLFGQPEYADYALVRVMGAYGVALALVMVLVAQRIEELWWWSWAFVAATAPSAVVLTANAAFSLPAGAAAWPWWLFSGVAWAFTAGLLFGIARSGLEKPPA